MCIFKVLLDPCAHVSAAMRAPLETATARRPSASIATRAAKPAVPKS